MKPVHDDMSTVLAVQQKQKKAVSAKGDRSSKEPNALCHLPSHSLSMHSNSECRSQNPSLPPIRSSQAPRPMGRAPVPNPPLATSRGLAAISMLSDNEKARLFDHLHHAQANAATSHPPSNTTATQSTAAHDDSKDQTVYFANAYSAVARSSTKSEDMISDSGADRFIFHSIEEFLNL